MTNHEQLPVVVVAGITRSGLTMTMQMLHAGGFPCLGSAPAFEDYSIGSIPWHDCQGMAVKAVDTHNRWPPKGQYKVIRLARNLREQSISFMKFCRFVGINHKDVALKTIVRSFRDDYKRIDRWAAQYPMLTLDFEAIIMQPREAAKRLASFLETPLDIEAMAQIVVPRTTRCYDGMLEAKLLKGAA